MYPDRVAVKTKNLLLTYAALNRAANQVAHMILAQSGEGEAAVALLLEHGAGFITALLAVWKAGKIYVPLDPALPHARSQTILEDTQTRVIVTNARNRAYAQQIQKDLGLIDIDAIAEPSSANNS